jgi:hypothetical protein
MPKDSLFRGWGLGSTLKRTLKHTFTKGRLSTDAEAFLASLSVLEAQMHALGVDTDDGRKRLASAIAQDVLETLGAGETDDHPYLLHLKKFILDLFAYEGWFDLRSGYLVQEVTTRAALWELEDELKSHRQIIANFDSSMSEVTTFVHALVEPLCATCPALLSDGVAEPGDIVFETELLQTIPDIPVLLDDFVSLPSAPEFERFTLFDRLRSRIQYNQMLANGLSPSDAKAYEKPFKLPSQGTIRSPATLISTYLSGTPLARLFDYRVPLVIPKETRFEHCHIVAGSGHGKTQTLQQLLLSDLEAVADGKASVIVIDSQKDLIDTIAGLALFREGGPLFDRLCIIDPTDVEWPVALNLFDIGKDRIGGYSTLDQERLINGVLELYDFVLGSLLDAGMTQKQNIIFRYITRLLLQIPGATIHTFRELLDDGGSRTYAPYIAKLTGSARAFFEGEFDSKEFSGTKKQVLRRLYGILENQTFERLFSHQKCKLDLFAEMNAGKVILINTAKDLLKENGTQIFGRFFIALITQAAQERAVLHKDKRMPTFVFVDEASDYFDQNIGIILSQARKQRVSMTTSHQFLGQLDSKLYEAIAANTAIKLAGGVSAKDARALAPDMRCDASFIEGQEKLSFAAYVKGVTKSAVSVSVTAGIMEALPRLTADELQLQRDWMREKYAVHYSEIDGHGPKEDPPEEPEPPVDTGEPMPWN